MTDKTLEIAWGARAIGEIIGRTERQTHWLLEQGAIRAAHKISEKKRSGWFASVVGLRQQFCPDDDTPDEKAGVQTVPQTREPQLSNDRGRRLRNRKARNTQGGRHANE